MKAMAALGGRGRLVRIIALGLVVAACGGTTGAANGGESHFLRECDGGCGAGLECISGVCTRACVLGKDSCTDLGANAECTDQSIEPGAVVICDVGCSRDRDCSSLGAGYECQAGFCRGAALSSAAGGGSANEGGASNGDTTGGRRSTGGSAGATGGRESTGGSANQGGAGDDSGGTAGAGASCRVLHQTYPSGTSGIPDPSSCNHCTCEDGALACTLMNCVAPVFPCPESVVTDPIDVLYYAIEGDNLVLDVSYGGCGAHDFGVCYEQSFRESSPVQGTLRVLHDQHDETCERLNESTLTFSLIPYADYYNELYQTDGGLISTNYGMYGFGELTCDERAKAAGAQVASVAAQLPLTCSSAADCEWAGNVTTCSAGCGTLVARSETTRWTTALDAISTSTCTGYEEDGCTRLLLPCIAPPELDCVDGQCTERTLGAGGAGSDGGAGAGTGSPGGAAGVGGSVDGSCRVLHQTYASGTTGIRDPAGCGMCECQDGQLSCDNVGCEIGPPVFPCPDNIVSDDITVTIDFYSIQGDKLVLDLSYGGGCENHDFAVCYEPGFRESDPVQGTLRLLHDAHDDACKAIKSANLAFDLRPYADYYRGLYQTDGGRISTDYGLYAFGALTCEERLDAAGTQLDSVLAHLDSSCASAADCAWVENVTDCADRCGALIPVSQEDRFTQALDDIDATLCAGYEADGCTRTIPPCIAPAAVDCVDGQCAAVPTP
jgi:hypothetical protein